MPINPMKLTTFIGFAIPRNVLLKLDTINLPNFITVAERGNKVILGDSGISNLEHRTSRIKKVLNLLGLSEYKLRLFCFVEV